ncbi:uncharacterized protein PFL1_06709 [Pseudozyma flocculosa PF-1]|nr:uncharacterized protein PFL1_06709 [Pseudozyma flocculosa PF-1]EPQ25715.1 hypothetical protein PFL1_06709 [Pseudozyma flocculosa PF-1]
MFCSTSSVVFGSDAERRDEYQMVRRDIRQVCVPSISITHAPLESIASSTDTQLLRRAFFDFQPKLLEDRADEAQLLRHFPSAALPRTTQVGSSEAMSMVDEPSSTDVEASQGEEAPFGSMSEDAASEWDEGLALLIRIRNLQDARAFFELSREIDDCLSDFLNFKQPRHLDKTFERLVMLITLASRRELQVASPASLRPRAGVVDISAMSPPSLRGEQLFLSEPMQRALPDEELRARKASAEAFLHLQAVEKLCDILVSGFSCLLADVMMPHHGPAAMARLCDTLDRRLDAAIASDVKASPGSHGTGVQSSQHPMGRKGTCASGMPKPSSVLLEGLQNEFEKALERGYLIRDRVSRLTVGSGAPRRKLSVAPEPSLAREEHHLDKLRRIRQDGLTNEERRDMEFKTAARGSPRHMFMPIDTVRFLGELYKLGLQPLSSVRDWLQRLLYDTARPELPSVWELECACALLITCGQSLESDSRTKRDGRPGPPIQLSPADRIHLRLLQTPSKSSLPVEGLLNSGPSGHPVSPGRKDSAPASHWIRCPPTPSPGRKASLFSPEKRHAARSSGLDIRRSGVDGPATTPSAAQSRAVGDGRDGARLLQQAMDRLEELCKRNEYAHEVKEWIRAVVELRRCGWRPPARPAAKQASRSVPPANATATTLPSQRQEKQRD